jgi:predicted amidophosphoribosyltransferase
MALCNACQQRWSQSRLGLCRRCERETGADDRTLFERERETLERQRARRPAAAPAPVPAPQSLYVRQVDGVEFDVVWDGRR